MHILGVIGQIIIGLFFVFMGLYNLKNRTHLMASIKQYQIKIGEWIILSLVILEIASGVMIVLNFMAILGAIYLAFFTALVSYTLHPFWTVKDKEMWKHVLAVTHNAAIVGGLFLILAMQ